MLPSGLPETVEDDEPLARFLKSSRQFNTIMAKPVAFLPNSKNGRLSTCRHGREPLAALKELGAEYFRGQDHINLHGVAIVAAGDVRMAAPLTVEASEPPRRHADVKGWIKSEQEAEPRWAKADNLHLATTLAERSELLRW